MDLASAFEGLSVMSGYVSDILRGVPPAVERGASRSRPGPATAIAMGGRLASTPSAPLVRGSAALTVRRCRASADGRLRRLSYSMPSRAPAGVGTTAGRHARLAMQSCHRHRNACGAGDLLNNPAGSLLDSNAWGPHEGRRLRDAQTASRAAMRGTSCCWGGRCLHNPQCLGRHPVRTAACIVDAGRSIRGIVFDGRHHVNIAHRNPAVRFRTHPEFSRQDPRKPDFN
jgi:hypothetical protein